MFFERFQTFGQAPALVGEDGSAISHAELHDRLRVAADRMGPGRKLIVIPFDRDVESITAYLAALSGGHAAILTVPAAEAIEEAERMFAPDLIAGGGVIERRAVRKAGGLPHPDLALVMRTSGSTGCAKFVRLSRRNIASNADAIVQYMGLRGDDLGVTNLPLHYSYGLSVLNSHFASGGGLLVTKRSVLDPEFLDLIERAGCTNLAGVPYSYELYERVGLRRRTLPALRCMTSAGGKLPPNTVRTYAKFMRERGGRFFAMYGQTEATARIAYLPPELAEAYPEDLGRAIPGGELDLIGDELVYRGPNVMMGYARDRRDLERGNELRELRTGDIAVRTKHGFRITGRKSRFSKIAGMRIGHAEVEAKLAARGRQAAVVGDDQKLFAAFVGGEGGVADLAAATGLPRVHLDAAPVGEIPRLPSGKTDYAKLRETMRARRNAQHIPSRVQDAFAEAFYPRAVSGSDSFASLGGDSLSYVRLSIALEHILGSLPEGWELRPISGLKPAARTAAGFVETDFALRALAILTIVIHHATQWPIAGGAAALLMLAGLNLARFQSGNLFAGKAGPMLSALARNLLPYFLVLAIFAAMLGPQPWQVWTLTGNLGIGGYTPIGKPHLVFWFVEAYAHILIGTALLFSVGPVRRAIAERPFEGGLVLLVLALLTRLATFQTWDGDHLRIFTTGATFYIFVFGWCLYFADTPRKKAAMFLLALALFPVAEQPDFLERFVKVCVLIACAAIVLYVGRVRMPRFFVPVVLTLAAASYPIYLFHDIPSVALTLQGVPFGDLTRTLFVIGAGLALGLLVYAMPRARPIWNLGKMKGPVRRTGPRKLAP